MTARNSNNIQLWFARYPAQILDVRTFTVSERMHDVWSITLTAVCHPEQAASAGLDPAELPLESFVDLGAAMTIGHPDGALRVWSGICSEIRHVSERAGGSSIYELKIVPELGRLALRRNSRIFQHKSVPEIAVKLLSDWNIEGKSLILRNFQISDYDRFPKFEYRVQYEETDLSFFARLLEEAGLSFYFEYDNAAASAALRKGEALGHDLTRVVLDADPQIAHPRQPPPEAEGEEGEEGDASSTQSNGTPPGNGKFIEGPMTYLGTQAQGDVTDAGDVVLDASFTRAVKPGSVTILDHDFRRNAWEKPGRPKQAEPTPSGDGAGPYKTTEAQYEVLAYVPGALQREVDPAEGDQFKDDPSNRKAKDALRALRAEAAVSQFRSNALQLCPGSVVQFGSTAGFSGETHPRPELADDKKHLVVGSHLSGSARGPWMVSCWSVPAELPYRPPEATPKPRIHGVQSAVIVGKASSQKEQIFCDPHGRVRIQFHWDRQHLYGADAPLADDPLGSCWVRVATPWAGANYGFVSIPRVGHEVLVSFLDGDPDQPMIVGSLYNGVNRPPYKLAKEGGKETIAGLKSNTTPNGGGFNEMFFDDAKGKELIHFQAQKNMTTVVKAAETRSVGGSRTTTIGAEDALHVGQKFELAVGEQGTGITAHENTYIILQVGGADGAQVMLSGTGVYLQAKSDIHLHAGTDIHLSAVGQINIDGGVVNINCGQPEAVELPGYAKAAGPAAGAAIPGGPIPSGGGGMPEPPRGVPEDAKLTPLAPPPIVQSSVDGVSADPEDALRGERFVPPSLNRTPGMMPSAAASAAPSAALSNAPPTPNRSIVGAAVQASASAAASAAATKGSVGQAALGGVKGAVGAAIGNAAGAAIPAGAAAPILSAAVGAAATAALGGSGVGKAVVGAAAGAAASAVIAPMVGGAAPAVAGVAAKPVAGAVSNIVSPSSSSAGATSATPPAPKEPPKDPK